MWAVKMDAYLIPVLEIPPVRHQLIHVLPATRPARPPSRLRLTCYDPCPGLGRESITRSPLERQTTGPWRQSFNGGLQKGGVTSWALPWGEAPATSIGPSNC